jgi:hypothetical protein
MHIKAKQIIQQNNIVPNTRSSKAYIYRSLHYTPTHKELFNKTFAIQQKIYFSEKRREEDLNQLEKLYRKKNVIV